MLCKYIYKVEVLNYLNPELQLKITEFVIRSKMKELLAELKGFTFEITLFFLFRKIEIGHERKYCTFYSLWKTETIINDCNIDAEFESVYTTMISTIQKSLEKGLVSIIHSVAVRPSSVSNYKPLRFTSYSKVPTELDHPEKV